MRRQHWASGVDALRQRQRRRAYPSVPRHCAGVRELCTRVRRQREQAAQTVYRAMCQCQPYHGYTITVTITY